MAKGGYDVEKGTALEFMSLGQCPSNETYVFRPVTKLVVRDSEGNLVRKI